MRAPGPFDHEALPGRVVCDPELTLGLPARITATSSVNALAHCVEAFYAPASSPLSRLTAEEGIRALIAGVPTAVASPEDREARGLLLGGALDLPHAETHTVVLPQVVAFVEPALPADSRERIRAAVGAEEEGESAATALFDLAASLDVPTALRELDLPEDAIEPLLDQILESAWQGRRPTQTDDPDRGHA
ncbi:MAG: iron-containing alcohol dehydrogenase [Solirubrobacterales bacterium]